MSHIRSSLPAGAGAGDGVSCWVGGGGRGGRGGEGEEREEGKEGWNEGTERGKLIKGQGKE